MYFIVFSLDGKYCYWVETRPNNTIEGELYFDMFGL